jgi:hypothetical protein
MKHELFFRNVEDANDTSSNLTENKSLFHADEFPVHEATLPEDADEFRKRRFEANPLKASISWQTEKKYTEEELSLIHYGCASGLASWNYNRKG